MTVVATGRSPATITTVDASGDRFVAHGLIERKGAFLVLRRREGRYLGGQWDIPGGMVEEGESPAEAAVRECWEEAGIKANVVSEFAHYENADTKGRDITFHTITFLLREADSSGDIQLSAEEHDDFRWVTPAEASTLPLVWHVEKTFVTLAS